MHTTIMAQNLFQVGQHLGPQMIGLAKWLLFGGAAFLATISYLTNKHTHALRVIAIALVLIGIISNLTGLGQDSGETINSVRGSTR